MSGAPENGRPSTIPQHLRRQGYRIEHDGAVANLRRALLDVQGQVKRPLADLDDAELHGYGDVARSMAASAGEATRYAGELDMVNRLRFLLPGPSNPQKES
ncbi:hypothetical protein [Streptosporangium sp. NPDC049376]|uniref:hypothetical protein n=1 Tax=Streptosporangium sp. NPDC049376 TaxID=3366192 RepID=UPI0037889EE8